MSATLESVNPEQTSNVRSSLLLDIIGPICIRHLEADYSISLEAFGSAIFQEFSEQLKVAKVIAQKAGRARPVKNDVILAGKILSTQVSRDDDNAALAVIDDVFSCFSEISEIELSEENSSPTKPLDKVLLNSSAEFVRLFRFLPMGSSPDDGASFMLSCCLSLADEFSRTSSEFFVHPQDILELVTKLAIETWVELASTALNPSRLPLTQSDVEEQLTIDLLPLVRECPLGHIGNESAVIPAIASEVFNKAEWLAAGIKDRYGEAAGRAAHSAFSTLYLCPLARTAWRRMADRRVDGVESMDDAAIRSWLLDTSDPMSIASILAELSELVDRRSLPTETIYIDPFLVENEIRNRFTAIWGVYGAVNSAVRK